MIQRPTPRLDALQRQARSADVVMNPTELGSARLTRHSFSRSLIRSASSGRWKVTRRLWDMDSQGSGKAIYRVEAGGQLIELILFSHVIAEEMRTDRVIAEDWDVTGALVEREITPEDMDILAANVTRQEEGRADDLTLVWGRANRSERFFDYVVDRLAAGQQPDPSVMSDAAYIMRSTAFYGNGKWGLRDFDGLDPQGPLSVPFRAQILSAWLFREFSADLVEHCAAAKSNSAVALSREWRRFLGLGNATGLGLVPYAIRHPQVLDAWTALRELPLANAMGQDWAPQSTEWTRVCALLERSIRFFDQKRSFSTEPYLTGPEIATGLAQLLAVSLEYKESGTINGQSIAEPARELHALAAHLSIEVRQIVDSVLIEIDSSLDSEIESMLMCVDRTRVQAGMSIGELRQIFTKEYAWALAMDFEDPRHTAKFWFYSASSGEPRRGVRGTDRGERTEHPVGIARDIKSAYADIVATDSNTSVGEFLVTHPEHWGIIERVQSVAEYPYSEARVNALGEDYLPLDLQRFQLAVYGMENFNPQSTDWLRVTLFSGAPTVDDISEGVIEDDWLFLPRPELSQ